MTLQEDFLTKLMAKELPVAVFTTNGFKMRGRITGFDQYVVILDVGGVQQMVYKHAVSTIVKED